MNDVCLALPILPGKTNDARAFQRELADERMGDYDRSERRLGISKEVWHLAALPGGDCLIAHLECADFQRAFTSFVASRDAFDLWFKRRLAEVTGVDLNAPPPDLVLPELLSQYQA